MVLAAEKTTGVNAVALTIVIVLFLAVTVLGFMAARWRRAGAMGSLDEWGLGGRGFGTFVTWFLLGGDLYTAYTFVAVPAAMFATGAVAGFFAVPYTIIVYPIIFVFMARLWSVSHTHGYVTPADFVRGRYGSKGLSLAIALTGILATMPYIALRLVGIQAVLEVMGIGGSGNVIARDLPLLVAFAVLAAYTYSSGLRAPALIAFVKDGLIYLVILVAVIYLPHKARRLRCDLRRGRPEVREDQPEQRPADRRAGARHQADLAVRDARARVGHGAVHVPALDHRGAVVQEPQRDPAQRLDPAGVLVPARPAGAARVRGDRRRHQAARPRRQAERAAGHPAACSRTSSRRGSPASRSPPSPSAPWCRPRSCRSPPRTCSPATSTATS
ncbi:hypothetical protein GCM10025868_38110 [Angustibacter aerolatus]|uniref:Sodium:solute symporter n=1 Tax=Angustibacter aerolatus TaxID=1162965 RepID=A0ABQ6JLY5_9ACTN|nr:hypothetical protein GCM10025868_38110 [Angustibacter aerolatus]